MSVKGATTSSSERQNDANAGSDGDSDNSTGDHTVLASDFQRLLSDTSELEIENLLRLATPLSTSRYYLDSSGLSDTGTLGSPLPSLPLLARADDWASEREHLLTRVASLEEERDSALILCEEQSNSMIIARALSPRIDLELVSPPHISEPYASSASLPRDADHRSTPPHAAPHYTATPDFELVRITNHNQQLRKELASARALNVKLVSQNFQLISQLKESMHTIDGLQARINRVSKQRSRTKEVIESGLEKLSNLKATCRSRPASQILLPSYIAKLAMFKEDSQNRDATLNPPSPISEGPPTAEPANKEVIPTRPRSLLPQRVTKPRPNSCHIAFPSTADKSTSIFSSLLPQRSNSTTTRPRRNFLVHSHESITSASISPSCPSQTPTQLHSQTSLARERGQASSPGLSDDSWFCLSARLRPDSGRSVSVSPLVLGSRSPGIDSFSLAAFAPPLSPSSASAPTPTTVSGMLPLYSLVNYVITSQEHDPIYQRMIQPPVMALVNNKLDSPVAHSPASPMSPASPASPTSTYNSQRTRLTASPDLRYTPREQLQDLFSTILSRASRPRSMILEKYASGSVSGARSGTGLGKSLGLGLAGAARPHSMIVPSTSAKGGLGGITNTGAGDNDRDSSPCLDAQQFRRRYTPKIDSPSSNKITSLGRPLSLIEFGAGMVIEDSD